MYGKDGKNIKLIVDALTKQTSPSPKGSPAATTSPTKDEIKKFIFNFMYFADPLLQYTEGHVKDYSQDKNNPLPTEQSLQVRGIQNASDTLLKYLGKFSDDNKNQHKDAKKRIYIFDDLSTTLLKQLSASISALSPSNFHGFHNPLLLDALKAGMEKFTEQLGHAYVNVYSGKTHTKEWVKQESKQVDGKAQSVTVLSTEGRNCAKVCLTILEILSEDLWKLRNGSKSEKNKNKKIILHNGNGLGAFLEGCGFEVSKDDKTQDGELDRNKTGQSIIDVMVKKKQESPQNVHAIYEDAANRDGALKTLIGHLDSYYRVSHHKQIPGAKAPSNIYQMLQWLLGLYFNPMYSKLEGYFGKLFSGLKDEYNLSNETLDVTVPDDIKKVMASPLDASKLNKVLKEVCLYSADALIAIQGHGHPDGRYAVDFYTNTDNLLYPGRDSACFDMLADTLFRVYNQLRFLYKQCNNGPNSGGWQDCHYGRYIGGSSWNCNDFQCPEQSCRQKHNQSCNQPADQKANQTVSQHYNCGIKSPLQSFLEDGLQGFLPHPLTEVGCGVKCSVGSHFGKPCLTPMGFTDISNVASRTQKGEDLKKLIEKFCGSKSDLRQLCSMLNCLLRRPPQTLGDIIAFYNSFLYKWSSSGAHKKDAFEIAVKSANFGNPETTLEISTIFASSSHDTHATGKENKLTGDMFSLVSCKPSAYPVHPCGRYLQPLTSDVHCMFSEKHADKYLSWVVYITETFYDLLKILYDDCCKQCDTIGTKCHDKGCVDNCQVRLAYEAENSALQASSTQPTNTAHDSDCHSIVKCQNTHPTLYTYGFTFGSPHELSGVPEVKNRRTCKDLCHTLKRVISEREADKAPLAELIFRTIPEYLLKIRWPFMLTLLALWSLSLLYLLHIAVVRLDVLRIRSHLRSPSSHRIAAQSLLAAARVKALANVKYFSP
ncbi:hypothetical protein, conserved [Babesia ovata]|uniref:Uncharacterized protein n=1 Tax=Babesia ovata TaxID=189622 RepID=A0A2H6KK09_9APIC|nr:uncharacterized protein BOVATA_048150 [Babesia ovata]GBE63322.1 hypothetical protein, conserved [Babesia ovata]